MVGGTACLPPSPFHPPHLCVRLGTHFLPGSTLKPLGLAKEVGLGGVGGLAAPLHQRRFPSPLIFKEIKAFTLGKKKKKKEKRSQACIKAAGAGSYGGFVRALE